MNASDTKADMYKGAEIIEIKMTVKKQFLKDWKLFSALMDLEEACDRAD